MRKQNFLITVSIVFLSLSLASCSVLLREARRSIEELTNSSATAQQARAAPTARPLRDGTTAPGGDEQPEASNMEPETLNTEPELLLEAPLQDNATPPEELITDNVPESAPDRDTESKRESPSFDYQDGPQQGGGGAMPKVTFPRDARRVDRFCPDIAPLSPGDLPKVWAILVDGQDSKRRIVTRTTYREHPKFGHVFEERVVDDAGIAAIKRIFARDYVCHNDVLFIVMDEGPTPYLLDYNLMLSLDGRECDYRELSNMPTAIGVAYKDVIKMSCGNPSRINMYYARYVGLVRIEMISDTGPKIDVVFERYSVN